MAVGSIVGHKSPDHDCSLALWLLREHGGFREAPIEFVDAGSPEPDIMGRAAAVVDVGGGFFDHHKPPGADVDVCAARIVANWVTNEHGAELSHLEPLIELVAALDTGRISREATISDHVGIHAALRGLARSGQYSDHELACFCFMLYEGIERDLRARKVAQDYLHSHTVYSGMDGMFLAVTGGDRTVADVAGEEGARLTLFTYEFPLAGAGGECATSYVCALRRTDRLAPNPDLVRLVAYVKGILSDDLRDAFGKDSYTLARRLSDCLEELNRWYVHPAGYYAGRGIEAAPCLTPVEADMELLAQYIERAWEEKTCLVYIARGGSNDISNIQPLCLSCNCSKSDRHDTDYRDT